MSKALTGSDLLKRRSIKVDPNAKRIENFGAASEERMEGTAAFRLPVDVIDDSPYQPRQAYDPEALRELAATIRAAGQQEPVKVRQKEGGRYELISGHRRLRALRDILERSEIDAYIVGMSDTDAERATMLANESRANLTDYERAKLYQLARDRGLAKTQQEIAAYFGTSQTTVSRCLSMLTLPEEYLRRLEENPAALSASDAAGIHWHLENPEPPTPVAAPVSRVKPKPAARRTPSIITGQGGNQLFAARAAGREIAVKIIDDRFDAETVKRAIVEVLKRFAEEEDQKREHL